MWFHSKNLNCALRLHLNFTLEPSWPSSTLTTHTHTPPPPWSYFNKTFPCVHPCLLQWPPTPATPPFKKSPPVCNEVTGLGANVPPQPLHVHDTACYSAPLPPMISSVCYLSHPHMDRSKASTLCEQQHTGTQTGSRSGSHRCPLIGGGEALTSVCRAGWLDDKMFDLDSVNKNKLLFKKWLFVIQKQQEALNKKLRQTKKKTGNGTK